jgi:hypothetical protein
MSGAVSSFSDPIDAVSAIGALAFGALGAVVLGPFLFSGFEVPEYIPFGGAQQMTVHKLPGGTRVVDLLGPDEHDIDWSGTMIDSLPDVRAQELDQMRVSGQSLPLVWGIHFYTVIIKSFEAEVHYGLIKYRISCLVLRNEAAAALASALGVTDLVSSDMATAVIAATSAAALAVTLIGSVPPPPPPAPVLQTAQNTVAGLGQLVPGSQSMALAAGAIGTAQTAMTAAQLYAEGGFMPVAAPAGLVTGATGLLTAVNSAASLAQLSQAGAYLGRAAGNVAA